ncbi:ABC transporter permease, partial [Candidatus Aerophobetes bacterium]|nr:ABC transporter permease [Candidatus Aerophobetes bacterium]
MSSIGKNWVLIFLIAMLIIFSIARKSFFNARTFTNILVSSTCILLLATGETFVIVTGGIDLSIGFVRGLAAVLSALIMRNLNAAGYPAAVSILSGCSIGILVGFLPGLVNGILVAKLKVPPFIATLGMYGIANGLALKLCGGFPITFLPSAVSEIGNGFIAYLLPGKSFTFFHKPSMIKPLELRSLIGIIPYSVIVAVVLAGIFGFILAKTKFGQHTYAIGGSIDAAVRAGINVPSHLIKIY